MFRTSYTSLREKKTVYTQVWFIKVVETRKIRVKVWYVKFEFDDTISSVLRIKPLQNKKGQNNLGCLRKKQSFYKEKDCFFLGYPKFFWPFLFWSSFISSKAFDQNISKKPKITILSLLKNPKKNCWKRKISCFSF